MAAAAALVVSQDALMVVFPGFGLGSTRAGKWE
jgi:hypothetical protein